MHWQPSASFTVLKQRALVLQQIRKFFHERNVLEVETPLLSHAATSDTQLASFVSEFIPCGGDQSTPLYLPTSPEYPMKRLLAAGIGDIFQICKSFRNGEVGRMHNPEFTILEWYRLDFDHFKLAAEVLELLQLFIPLERINQLSYQQLFQNFLEIDPLIATEQQLKSIADARDLKINAGSFSKDTWLQVLMSECIEPQFADYECYVIYDFPANQAALARVSQSDPRVAHRFEVYVGACELANGFYELTNPKEQRQRFENDIEQRRQLGLPTAPIDEHLLAALEHGLPACAGVALGIDRLLMLHSGQTSIDKVIAFPYAIA